VGAPSSFAPISVRAEAGRGRTPIRAAGRSAAVHAGTLRLVQAAQHAPPRRDEGPRGPPVLRIAIRSTDVTERGHSGMMFPARITLPHFSVSMTPLLNLADAELAQLIATAACCRPRSALIRLCLKR
jgi:hypothetical protein